MEDFLSLAEKRRSIRKFSHKPLVFEDVMDLMKAASYAPSAGDLQPWRFIVVTDRDLQGKIVQHCPKQTWMHNAQLLIVAVTQQQKSNDYYGERGWFWASQGMAAAVQNILLCAADKGLGATWVGSFDADPLRDMLGIYDGFMPEGIIAIGYPDEEPRSKQLKGFESYVYFNSFGTPAEFDPTQANDWGEYFQKRKAHLSQLGKATSAGLPVREKIRGVETRIRNFLKREESDPPPRRPGRYR